MKNLSGKVVVVTGAASGIGCAIYQRLRDEGCEVVGCDINTGDNKKVNYLDVSDRSLVRELVLKVKKEYGKLDILVNCAGVMRGHSLEETDENEWDDFIKINLTSIYFLLKESVEFLKESKGCIVNVGSVLALNGVVNRAAYTASKSGVLGLTRQLAAEYSALGIRVNSISPGLIGDIDSNEASHRLMTSTTPLGRQGKTSEVAACVAFLCSDESSYVHGHNLVVDGGWSVSK